MSRGVNKVILIGNIGQDPDVRHLNGAVAATISVATSESWTDKQTGEKKERTEWHRVVLWGRLAEIAGEYLRKGSKVYIEGQLRTRKWQDKDGIDRYTTEIVAREMQMLGDASAGGASAGGASADSRSGSGASSRRNDDAAQNQASQRFQATTPAEEDFNDDIPF